MWKDSGRDPDVLMLSTRQWQYPHKHGKGGEARHLTKLRDNLFGLFVLRRGIDSLDQLLILLQSQRFNVLRCKQCFMKDHFAEAGHCHDCAGRRLCISRRPVLKLRITKAAYFGHSARVRTRWAEMAPGHSAAQPSSIDLPANRSVTQDRYSGSAAAGVLKWSCSPGSCTRVTLPPSLHICFR